MKKQFVLLSGNYPPETGGPSKFSESFSKWLSSNGYSVAVVSTSPGKSLKFDDQGVRVQLVSRRLPLFLRYVRSALAVINLSTRDSIILANGCLFEVLLVKILGRRQFFVKLPGDIVWEQARARKSTNLDMFDFQKSKSTIQDSILRIVSTHALKKSSKVLVPSSFMRSICLGWGIKDSKMVTIYNSVDIAAFRPKKKKKEFDLITVSRLISIKKIEEIIVLVGNLNLSLLVVGDGPIKTELQLLADKCNAKVAFYGSASQAELPNLYGTCRFFILNSEFEAGTPYSLLEARASGLVCIGKENTGCEDVITNRIDGFLVGDRSGLNLEKALRSAMELSEKEEHDFSHRAIADTSMRFSHENILRLILREIYEYA